MKTKSLYVNKEDCCGCGFCAFSCPQNNIEMISDEAGFLYPRIINNNCKNCKSCIANCPKKISYGDNGFQEYYSGYLKDKDEVRSCSSGGLATAISRGAIKHGFIVYGVRYSSDWKKSEYTRITDITEVSQLKSSKYSQSFKGQIYYYLKKDLMEGKQVVFFGLPCEIAAIANFFSKYRENLFLIELVCHGPTSPKVHEEYCQNLEAKFHSTLTYFNLRFKKDGNWKPYYILAKFANGADYSEEFSESSYGKAFLHFKRPSCNVCSFKDGKLQGDLMIGDYHYAHDGMIEYNPSGVSIALVHNNKGKELIDMCSELFSFFPASEHGAMMNEAIHHPIAKTIASTSFAKKVIIGDLESASKLPIVYFCDKCVKLKNEVFSELSKIKKSLKKI